MSADEVMTVVSRVIERETGRSVASIDPDIEIRQQVEFDSMRYVTISAAVESALGIELPIEVMNARTFNQFMNLVRAEVARKNATV